jgi:hypothetical protein
MGGGEERGEIPLLASGVVLLGLVGVAAAALGAGEAGGTPVDVGKRADGGPPAAAGRRLLPAVGGGAHRRRGLGIDLGRVWFAPSVDSWVPCVCACGGLCVGQLRGYIAEVSRVCAEPEMERERERDGTSVPVSSPGSQILKPASVKSPISA